MTWSMLAMANAESKVRGRPVKHSNNEDSEERASEPGLA